MDKLIYGVLVLAVLSGIAFYLFKPDPCVEPSDMQVALAQLRCARSLSNSDLHDQICKKLGRADNCDLEESDREVASAFIMEKVNECAKAALSKNNMCIDHVKDVLSESNSSSQ